MAEKEEAKKTEESVKEIFEEKEEKKDKKEEFFNEKKDKKSLFNRIMNIVLWSIVFAWMGVCLVDFFNVKAERKPVFCLKKETTTYSDGKVYTCTGLGYKIFNYRRTSFSGDEYGPFWAKDRTADTKY